MGNKLLDEIKKCDVHEIAEIEVNNIDISVEVRKMCELNHCGLYNKNWQCPPGVGDLDLLKDKVKKYEKAIVFSNVTEIEDSYDFEGMIEAGKEHSKKCLKIKEDMNELLGDKNFMILGAGGCSICDKCTYKENKPCRLPYKAIASMEAYGMDVVSLSKKCNMKYINGVNTVTYFGVVLFK